LTPEYIVNNWSDEELDLMMEKLAERKMGTPNTATVSAEQLAAASGGAIKVVKRGD